jgi:uncharacterized protein YjbI with pentapeptide repeats
MSQVPHGIEWDEAAFGAALERAAEGVIEAPGVRLSSQQLEGLLKAAPRNPEHPGLSFLKSADFSGATFSGETNFWGATFSGDANFTGATFSGDANFMVATFGGKANFTGATFGGKANFHRPTFGGEARFEDTTFRGEASFSMATFSGKAIFWAEFNGEASFYEATFSREATFGSAKFNGEANFLETSFGRVAIFNGATFTEDARFTEVTFGEAWYCGATFSREADFQIHVFGQLRLDEAVFARRVSIEASALHASFVRAAFRARADVQLRWAEVWFDDTDFAEPSRVARLEAPFLDWEKPPDDRTWICSLQAPPERFGPRVLSLRGARVAQLTLSRVDLRACQFARAHGLDELTLDQVEFARPPRGWHGWHWIRWRPLRWTSRRVIAEERQWRATQPARYGAGWDTADRRRLAWDPASGEIRPDVSVLGSGSLPEGEIRPNPSVGSGWLPEAPNPLEAGEIATLYRELRKGLEDRRDEPGAADFYYGEMEMRRHSGPRDERAIVKLYWLVSGYGLRASRALAFLALTIVAGGLLLKCFGFHPHRSFWRSLLFSLESTISLLRVPRAKLSAGGEIVQIALRLLGPLFFGLALLALRGRVKR